MNNSFCEFIITSDNESPDEISDILKVTPTRSFSKGETYKSPSSGSIITRPHNLWAINTKHILVNPKIDRHISHLRKSLESKIHLIKDLKSNLKCDLTFWVWITSPDSVISFDIGVKNTRFIGLLSAPLRFTIISG
ncbi:MAG: DUF4279 domain-containing protein [Flavisolibacter sp.]